MKPMNQTHLYFQHWPQMSAQYFTERTTGTPTPTPPPTPARMNLVLWFGPSSPQAGFYGEVTN